MIDIHCHILPGLDDGAQGYNEALEMARIAEVDGIRIIVATPHIFRGDIEYKDFEDIRISCSRLNKEIEKAGLRIKIIPGAEVHIAHDIVEQVRRFHRFLVINEGDYMLLEFPSGHVYPGVENLFFELMGENIIPIIAHPERNQFFIHNPGILYKLLQNGALAQANCGSFLGVYGSNVRQTALNFLDCNFYQFVGSDGHNTSVLSPKLSEVRQLIQDIKGPDAVKAYFWDNPQAVIANKQIPDIAEAIDPANMRRSLKIKLPRLFSYRRK